MRISDWSSDVCSSDLSLLIRLNTFAWGTPLNCWRSETTLTSLEKLVLPSHQRLPSSDARFRADLRRIVSDCPGSSFLVNERSTGKRWSAVANKWPLLA